ncbi:MAG TPA: cupin domain-containing protein [Solirubrobacteraceae bacterium]|nr:cupin domain-containing protein [Solirubrobacteraceae bacterium]
MSMSADPAVVTVGEEQWEPFYVDGERMGDMHWLRPPSEHARGPVATVWRVQPGDAPAEIDYRFDGDELWHVLEGAIDVTYEDGRRYTLSAGDIGAFPRGGHATLRLTTPFKKAYMVA